MISLIMQTLGRKYTEDGIIHNQDFLDRCDGLNENGPHRLIDLNVWFSASGLTAHEGLGGLLLEDSKSSSQAQSLSLSLFLSLSVAET